MVILHIVIRVVVRKRAYTTQKRPQLQSTRAGHGIEEAAKVQRQSKRQELEVERQRVHEESRLSKGYVVLYAGLGARNSIVN